MKKTAKKISVKKIPAKRGRPPKSTKAKVVRVPATTPVLVVEENLEKLPKSLKVWMGKIRSAYKNGTLEKDKIKALNAVPGWKWVDRSSFDKRCNALKNYVARYGHAQIPADHIENGIRLATWCTAQRAKYRKNLLDSYQIQSLESVDGWKWDVRARPQTFEEMVDALKSFYQGDAK